jgi:hypothetical protein
LWKWASAGMAGPNIGTDFELESKLKIFIYLL